TPNLRRRVWWRRGSRRGSRGRRGEVHLKSSCFDSFSWKDWLISSHKMESLDESNNHEYKEIPPIQNDTDQAGSDRRNRAPPSSESSAATLPPYVSAMRRTMASPSPNPRLCPVCSSSRRSNGTNTRSRLSI